MGFLLVIHVTCEMYLTVIVYLVYLKRDGSLPKYLSCNRLS